MRKKKHQVGVFLLCVGGLVGFSGCAVPELQQQAVLKSMIGKSSLDLVRRFGVPTRTYKTDDHDFLAYIKTRANYSPGSWGGGWNGGYGYGYGPGLRAWGGGIPPNYTTLSCQTTFELENDRVLRWTLRGDGC